MDKGRGQAQEVQEIWAGRLLRGEDSEIYGREYAKTKYNWEIYRARDWLRTSITPTHSHSHSHPLTHTLTCPFSRCKLQCQPGLVPTDISSMTVLCIAGRYSLFRVGQCVESLVELDLTPLGRGLAEGEEGEFHIVLFQKLSIGAKVSLTVTARTPDGQIDPRVTITPASANFTDFNWKQPRTLKIAVKDDWVAQGDVDLVITVSAPVTDDENYRALSDVKGSLRVFDNNIAGVIIQFEGGLTTYEADNGCDALGRSTATFSVMLRSQPLYPVVICFSSDTPTEGIVCGASGDGGGDKCAGVPFTFDALNWNIKQVVRVTGVDDLVADRDQTYTVSGTAHSKDPNYDGENVKAKMSFDFFNVDDDVAGFNFAGDTALEVKEGGARVQFSVRLTSKPLDDVTVLLKVDTPGVVTIAQACRVGDSVRAAKAGDREARDALITSIQGDSITVRWTNIVHSLHTLTAAQVEKNGHSCSMGDSLSLEFTPGNYNVSQQVHVLAVDNDIVDGKKEFSISFVSRSKDPTYVHTRPATARRGFRFDNDIAQVIVSRSDGIRITKGGVAETVVKLQSKPDYPVEISFSNLRCGDENDRKLPTLDVNVTQSDDTRLVPGWCALIERDSTLGI